MLCWRNGKGRVYSSEALGRGGSLAVTVATLPDVKLWLQVNSKTSDTHNHLAKQNRVKKLSNTVKRSDTVKQSDIPILAASFRDSDSDSIHHYI